MINRGKLWIIPNEEEILQEVYEKDVEKGKSHTYRLQEFSNMYKLGFEFTEADYQTAPCEIAKLGHLVVKTEDDVSLAVCYIPERVTDRQYNWLYQNRLLLDKYTQINAYSVQVIEEDGICWKKLHGIDEIILESNRKNLLSKKGMKR